MTVSYATSKDSLLLRLKKVEGQIKGIQRMVEEEQYCVDVMIQIAAARAALNSVGTIIFEHHMRGCLKSAVQRGNVDEMVEELIQVMGKFNN